MKHGRPWVSNSKSTFTEAVIYLGLPCSLLGFEVLFCVCCHLF